MSIWKYKEVKNTIINTETELLTLNEGETLVNQFVIDNNILFLKREDLNPTGSWKDRASAYKITELKEKKITNAVMASSGNAAISLLTYSKLYPELSLHIVLKNNVNSEKKGLIEKLVAGTNHKLYYTDTPRKLSVEIAVKYNAQNLKTSIDSNLSNAYFSLGIELSALLNKTGDNSDTAVFINVSSGTAFIGIAAGILFRVADEYCMPKLVACQTDVVHPLVPELPASNAISLADAIYDTTCTRAPQIKKIVANTNGSIAVLSNDNILNAQNKLLDISKIHVSNTSALAMAGYLKEKARLNIKKGIIICSGR